MAEALKDFFFQDNFFSRLKAEINKEYSAFNSERFEELVFDGAWKQLELRARMKHLVKALKETLPENYLDALEILKPVSKKFSGFEAMIFSDFVEDFGLDFVDESLAALALFTEDASSEFAIRPFIRKYRSQTMTELLKWAEHPSKDVRRLASEGTRPRLPWSGKLVEFIDDPSPILPILETLKNDESGDVRRSVANNLNDISKDHPEVVLEIAQRWFGKTKETDALIKHALRTLLKQGNKRALHLFGYSDADDVLVTDLVITPEKIRIGEQAQFCFKLFIKGYGQKKIRLEYAISFVKANGSSTKKVFQLSEGIRMCGKQMEILKKQWFKNLTTRKHYVGKHLIEIIVNGEFKAAVVFELVL